MYCVHKYNIDVVLAVGQVWGITKKFIICCITASDYYAPFLRTYFTYFPRSYSKAKDCLT